jgi:hypothetical protein
MQRREFLKSAIAAGSTFLWTPRHALAGAFAIAPPPEPQVKRVLVMFKCHFDAGFIDTQEHVVHRYFSEYFPHAIQIADEMRQSGTTPYIWTTGSWLVYEYLEQASTDDRKRMEQAIQRGDIAWHALPFSWQSEMLDRSMMEGSLGISQTLDRRFGQTTTGAKMTDVPGHTRGLIAPLAAHGVKFLDIGVNDASTPAELPPLFLWKNAKGTSLAVMYHHGYGGTTRVADSDLAIAIEVRGDNSGPHTPDEIREIYARLKNQFPEAAIKAANLTEIANAVEPYQNKLPVVTQEIGDTWIYGVPSDPLKVARYREVARLREGWITQAALHVGDTTDIALLRRLLLEVEHTWGTDTKTWLDFDHYTPKDLSAMLDTKNYKVVEFSWQEKRQDLFDGIAALPAPLKDEVLQAVKSLEAQPPQVGAAKPHPADKEIVSRHFVVKIDGKTGAIRGLRNRATGREWASPDHPLALFSYQALSQKDYAQFFQNYIVSDADWAKKDFGKPNIERFGAQTEEWLPALAELHVEEGRQGHRVLARLEIRDAAAFASGRAAFPQKLYMELVLPDAEALVHLNLYWFDKPATRMPEALWLSFNPIVSSQQGWTMSKSDEQVSPFDVAPAGNRHMHAVSGLSFEDAAGQFRIETLDAPVFALGEKSPLNFSRSQPDLSSGVHCSLFNNAWGTNYIMWFGENMRFRFVLKG